MSDASWIDWAGGECPVEKGTLIDVIFRDGLILESVYANKYTDSYTDSYTRDASPDFWYNDDSDNDIVAYRICKTDKVENTNIKDTNPKDAVGIRKAPLSVLPMSVVAEMGVAMLEGACKYGRHNYRAMGVRDSVYFDATMRHLIDYWEGVDIDPDSGMHHLTKALSSLAVWRDAQIQGMCTDDRPPRSKPFLSELNKKAGEIIDKHKDKSPKHWTIEDSK